MPAKPSKLVQRLRDQCRDRPGRIALPEISDGRVLKAALQLLKEKVVEEVHTLTTHETLQKAAFANGIDVKNLGDQFCTLKSEPDKPLFEAGHLLKDGDVDCVLAGAVYTTAEVCRAAIKTIGLAEGCKTISGSFLMNRESKTLTPHTFLFADCGVVIAPCHKQLIDIATETVRTWRKLMADLAPVVAFLSFSTLGSAKHPNAELIANVCNEFQHKNPDVECAGEIQLDAALDKEIGRRKAPDSQVPGRANCFIFPDLSSGNITYKATQRLGLFEAYGPILQGTRRPFSDLSRGATTSDIVASAYINLIRARQD